ncbi:hypothetical protein [Arthrobacter psychrolactophilus]
MAFTGGALPGPLGLSAAGPSPDAVTLSAQRLACVAQDIAGLRFRLSQLNNVDWNSTAASAFRHSLDDADTRFVMVDQQIGKAVELLGSYATYIRAAAEAVTCGVPRWEIYPGIGPSWGGHMGMIRVWDRL